MYDWKQMKKFKILIPVYNDWDSLLKLLNEINREIQEINNAEFHFVIINDASSMKTPKINIIKKL